MNVADLLGAVAMWLIIGAIVLSLISIARSVSKVANKTREEDDDA